MLFSFWQFSEFPFSFHWLVSWHLSWSQCNRKCWGSFETGDCASNLSPSRIIFTSDCHCWSVENSFLSTLTFFIFCQDGFVPSERGRPVPTECGRGCNGMVFPSSSYWVLKIALLALIPSHFLIWLSFSSPSSPEWLHYVTEPNAILMCKTRYFPPVRRSSNCLEVYSCKVQCEWSELKSS